MSETRTVWQREKPMVAVELVDGTLRGLKFEPSLMDVRRFPMLKASAIICDAINTGLEQHTMDIVAAMVGNGASTPAQQAAAAFQQRLLRQARAALSGEEVPDDETDHEVTCGDVTVVLRTAFVKELTLPDDRTPWRARVMERRVLQAVNEALEMYFAAWDDAGGGDSSS